MCHCLCIISEVNKCRKRAYSSAQFKITKEELSRAQNLVNRSRLEWLESNELLDDWISILKKVVEAVKDTYRASFQFLESGNFKNKPSLDNLKNVVISLTADLKVIKSWRPLVKDKGLLDNWISNIEEIVQVVEHVYCTSFKLLKSGGNFKNEPHLGNLRHVLISLTAELQVFKSWRLGVRACAP
jgi:hypothetical protein